ncbi:MAG: penicillin-binding protein 1A [Acidaminococcaceae bacterium]|nr:penicillin-binding protein 1A [Acidaminococcaceae bacterium]NLU43899.1 penicillin-binding protein 1A [Acholeplasmataceae bacterium]
MTNKNTRNHREDTSSSAKLKKKRSIMGAVFSAFIALVMVGLISIASFFGLAKFTTNTILAKDIVQPASSQFFDVNGDLLTTTDSEEDRLPVSFKKVPKNLQNAFLAAEDIRFYEHGGIDYKGIVRALFSNIFYGEIQGGSTITQQLAKNFFLTPERTLTRKVHEAFIALQLEQKYTKQEIFEMYLNQIYFGRGAYGVESAANTYFGKHVEDLSLAECAMLAGIPKSPNYYSPINNPKAGAERQKVVLEQMAKYNFITKDQMNKAINQKLVYKNIVTDLGSKKYFINYCIQLLIDQYGPDAVYKQGMKVYTTLDPDMQKAAEKAVKLTPNFYTDKSKLVQPQSALVAVDPQTGYIKAMIGGRGNDQFNRAVLAERQPGSAFKPFVYLNALEHGATPNTQIEDKEIVGDWNPHNYDNRWHGIVTMRTALIHSYNIPAIKTAIKYGTKDVVSLAKRFGITTLVEDGPNTDANPAMALGGLTHGVTPLEMAGAYAAMANMGVYNKPVAITKVVDRNGKVLYQHKANPVRVCKASNAYMLVDMMRDVMTKGSGTGAAISRPAAGKTGTTSEWKDAWFVGFTPDLSAAVWIGDDNNDSLGEMTGADEPASIWRVFMSSALSDIPASNFVKPSGFSMPEQVPDAAKKDENADKTKDKNADKKPAAGKDINSGKLPGESAGGSSSTPPKPPSRKTAGPYVPAEQSPIVSNKPTP